VRKVMFCLAVGLLFIPSVVLGEAYQPPEILHETTTTIDMPIETTPANDIEDIMGTYEPSVETPVSVPKTIVEETATVAPGNDLESIRADIRKLYELDDLRFEQAQENYDYLIETIEDLQGQIYELQ